MKLKLLLIFLNTIPIFTVFSQTGKSLNFDGANDVISVNGIDLNSKSFTVEYWAKRNVIDEGYVVGQGGVSRQHNVGLHIGFRPDATLKFGFFGNDLNSTIKIEDNNWHHYAFAYNATTNSRSIYIDGVLSVSDVASSDYIGSSTNTFYIGREGYANKFYFSGDLEEFRLWDHERSASEINTSKNLELDGTPTGLTLYYKFNQGNSDADNSTILNVIDQSANLNNGTLSNFGLSGSASNFTSAEPSDADKGIVLLNQSINPSYGTASNSNTTINYTIGQLFVSEFSNTQGGVFQGVQQVLEQYNSSTLSFTDVKQIGDVSVYPNPFKETFNINLKSIDSYNSYQILNTLGKKIQEGNITAKQTKVMLDDLSTGIYYLILTSNNTLKTIKLIKQ